MAKREHGTQRGYNQHIYRKEAACNDCKKAHAEHQEKYRKANPEQTRKQRERERPRARERYLERKANPEQHEQLKQNWRKKNLNREIKPEWTERAKQRRNEVKAERKRWLKTPEGQAWAENHEREIRDRRDQQRAIRQAKREAWLKTPAGQEHTKAIKDKERARWREKSRKRYEQSKVVGSPEYERKLYRRAKARTKVGDQRYVGRAASGWELSQRLAYFNTSCWICRCDLDANLLTWDHVKPLSKGGSLLASNMRPACSHCNSLKRDVWPLSKEFLTEIKRRKTIPRMDRAS